MAERQGIFTGVAHIYDPTSTTVVNGVTVRKEFPNDVINIPLDPAAQALARTFSNSHESDRQSQQLHAYSKRCGSPESVRYSSRRVKRHSRCRLRPLLVLQRSRAACDSIARWKRSNNRRGDRHRRRCGCQRSWSAGRRKRDTHLHSAPSGRHPNRLHTPGQHNPRDHSGRYSLGGIGHPWDSHQRCVQQCTAALHLFGVSAAWPFPQYVLAIPDCRVADGR